MSFFHAFTSFYKRIQNPRAAYGLSAVHILGIDDSASAVICAGDLQSSDRDIPVFDIAQCMVQRLLVLIVDESAEFRCGPDLLADVRKEQLCDQDEDSTDDSTLIETGAYSETDDAGGPQSRGSSQAFDGMSACHDDGTGADETESGDDLSADTRHVCGKPGNQIQIMSCQRCSCCADTDENVGAEPGRTIFDRALETNHGAAENRSQHADQHTKEIDIAKTIEKREQWETSSPCD